jgi:hypothetical protein
MKEEASTNFGDMEGATVVITHRVRVSKHTEYERGSSRNRVGENAVMRAL